MASPHNNTSSSCVARTYMVMTYVDGTVTHTVYVCELEFDAPKLPPKPLTTTRKSHESRTAKVDDEGGARYRPTSSFAVVVVVVVACDG
jgi:hypothetical protein